MEEPGMSEHENEAIVRRLFEEVLNQKRLDRADAFIAHDYVDHTGRPGQAPGLEGAKQVWAMLFAASPDPRTTIEDLIAVGDKVVVRWTAEGIHQGELVGIPPTGKRFRASGISIYRLADGRISDKWEEADRLGFLQQVGAIPAPAALAS